MVTVTSTKSCEKDSNMTALLTRPNRFRQDRLTEFTPLCFRVERPFRMISFSIRKQIQTENHNSAAFDDFFENNINAHLKTHYAFPYTAGPRQWIQLAINAFRIERRTQLHSDKIKLRHLLFNARPPP